MVSMGALSWPVRVKLFVTLNLFQGLTSLKSYALLVRCWNEFSMTVLFLIVEKGTILEPYDKKILAKLSENCNLYCKLVLFLKLDTQAYYNMRIILGYETVQ